MEILMTQISVLVMQILTLMKWFFLQLSNLITLAVLEMDPA